MGRTSIVWLVPVLAVALVGASAGTLVYVLMRAADAPLDALQTVGDVCLRLVTHRDVHWSALLLLGGVLAVAAVGGLLATRRAIGRHHRDARLRRLAEFAPARWPQTGSSAYPLHIVLTATPIAFAAGWRRPAIYLSSGALRLLTPREIQAVVAHETAHCRSWHLPKRAALLFLRDAFVFLPIVARACQVLIDHQELLADAQVWRHDDSMRRELLSALAKMLAPEDEQAPAPAFAGFGEKALEARIEAIRSRGDGTGALRRRDWGLTALTLSPPLVGILIVTDSLTRLETLVRCGAV